MRCECVSFSRHLVYLLLLMSRFSRRQFLKNSSTVMAAAALPRQLVRRDAFLDSQTLFERAPLAASSELRALVMTALDAARSTGAAYADVQVRTTRSEIWSLLSGGEYLFPPRRMTDVGIGIRALVNGCWGFAGLDGVPTSEDAGRLGRTATAQAKIGARGKPNTIDLAALPGVANGAWVMPIDIDPFTVSAEEKADVFGSLQDFIAQQQYGVGALGNFSFLKDERTFASSEGAYTTQTIYATQGDMAIGVPADWLTEGKGMRWADFLSTSGAGWEYILQSPLQDRAMELIEEAMRMRRAKRVDVGRYDVVFDAYAMASIVDVTLGTATELDRALGYTANTVGTSYLQDPLAMLGAFQVGSPLVTVTTNRSMPGGAATVKWDDEGVEPTDTPLVKDGVLVDFQTTRETASWIAPYYVKSGRPIRSNGCAGIHAATNPVTTLPPNFVLAPSAQDVGFDDLVKDTKRGLAVLGGGSWTDHQALNGAGHGEVVYEITNGKLGQCVRGVEYLYRSPEFWKGLVAIGGKTTARARGFDRGRNYVHHPTWHTVSAVPAKVKGIAVVDEMRGV